MSDIRRTLELVRQRLNEFIRAEEPRGEEWVVLSNLVDPEGHAAEHARNKLVMFLAGIQKETMVSTYTAAVQAGPSQYSIVAPPLYVNLYVLVMANFYDANYAEGLGMISQAIRFFQQNPSFTQDSLPGLPEDMDRLTWDMTNLDPLNLSYLMGLAGVKYLPSVYYKVRLLPFHSHAPQRQEPAVRGAQNPAEPEEPAPSAPAGPTAAGLDAERARRPPSRREGR
jgi:Pvc16 N-terminal domain